MLPGEGLGAFVAFTRSMYLASFSAATSSPSFSFLFLAAHALAATKSANVKQVSLLRGFFRTTLSPLFSLWCGYKKVFADHCRFQHPVRVLVPDANDLPLHAGLERSHKRRHAQRRGFNH